MQWDPYNVPILSEKAGTVKFHDIIEGVTMKQRTGRDRPASERAWSIIEHKEDLHPQIIMRDETGGEALGNYSIPAGAHIVVKEGQTASVAGTLLAKTPAQDRKTKDITGGLPRVAELFEARRPKDAAEIAKIDGIVDFGATRARQALHRHARREDRRGRGAPHPASASTSSCSRATVVKKGQQLTEGPIVPQEILDICGPQELQEYLVNEVQEVYRLQGVRSTTSTSRSSSARCCARCASPSRATPSSSGASRSTSAPSTTRTSATTTGGKTRRGRAAPARHHQGLARDRELHLRRLVPGHHARAHRRRHAAAGWTILRGFKENVIMGHLIPAGTGFPGNRGLKLKRLVSEAELIEAALEPGRRTDRGRGDPRGGRRASVRIGTECRRLEDGGVTRKDRRRMPTINQLVRKGRKPSAQKTKAPALMRCPQRRGVCLWSRPRRPRSPTRRCARWRACG